MINNKIFGVRKLSIRSFRFWNGSFQMAYMVDNFNGKGIT